MSCVSDSPQPRGPQCKLSSVPCSGNPGGLGPGFRAQRRRLQEQGGPRLPAEGLARPARGRPRPFRVQGPREPPPSLRSSSLCRAKPLDELEALGLVVGQAGLEEHRVHAELRVQQGHVAVHLDEEVDTLVPLMEVGIVV